MMKFKIQRLVTMLTFILLISFGSIYAQQQYQTSAGMLIVTIHLNNKPVTIKSKELQMLLDYETGNIVIKQDISSLTADNDTVQSKIDSMAGQQIVFEGKLGLDYINTLGHPPLDFQVEGSIQPGGKRIIGTGQLVHRVQGSLSACLLSLNFNIGLAEIFPDYQIVGLNNKTNVQVLQSLLGRVGD
jgi:hypothetical protein